MRLTGIKKAAVLLTTLDSVSAAELMKGLSSDTVKKLAIEFSQMDESQRDVLQQAGQQVAYEFFSSLKNSQKRINKQTFFSQVLDEVVGRDNAAQIKKEIKTVTQKSNPFARIRQATTDELVLAFQGEHHQTIAVILLELPPEKSKDILTVLDENTQQKVIKSMTGAGALSREIKNRMAAMVAEKLEEVKGQKLPEKPQARLRRLAVMLNGLDIEMRDKMMEQIKAQDAETAKKVSRLMVTWNDIPSIQDRSLQQLLRDIESKTLAMALQKADEKILKKIKSNISERAAESLDEEMSLMQEPDKKEIEQAREEVVEPMRQANEKGELKMAG
jgi:flagellar motor switch protein FliG